MKFDRHTSDKDMIMEADVAYIGKGIPSAEVVIRDRQKRASTEKAARETARQQELAVQKEIEGAANPPLVESHMATLKTEAAQAIERLKAKGWPGGELREIVTHYTPNFTGWLRKHINGYEQHTMERAVWHIDYGASAKNLFLGSDGVLYYFSKSPHKRPFCQHERYNDHYGYHAVENDKSDLFDPTRYYAEPPIEEVVRQLRLLGAD